jgi:predicted nuclease of restriction endonuclease-like (RecB) superfamily
MTKPINILDKDYTEWIKQLGTRYRRSQIKAAIKVNEEMLRFYWELGRDIVMRNTENKYGSGFMKCLSRDLKAENPDATCFSETNLLYMKNFYLLYQKYTEIPQQLAEKSMPHNFPQLVGKSAYNTKSSGNENVVISQQVAEKFTEQVVEKIRHDLFSVPWGHHMILIDKFSNCPDKALFFVRQTVENGWSRNVLLNFISTDLYERQGKALTNFKRTLPDETSDLAQELTKDPYNFAFTGITGRYNERLLKDSLLNNITNFLIELGTGFAYVGKEYRIQVGERENFIDLLFYNLNLSCYVVIEVKIGRFEFSDTGQLGGYVVACNHLLRREGRDNPTIGLLICKEKDRVQAQYALESSSQPISISEFDLEKFYPEKVEGTIPTIQEIEEKLAAMEM